MATMKLVPDASTLEGADRKLMRVQAQAWREFFLSSPIPADNTGRRQWILQVQEHCDEYIIEDVLIGLSRDQKDNDRFFLSSAAVEALVKSGLTPAEVEPFHFDPTISRGSTIAESQETTELTRVIALTVSLSRSPATRARRRRSFCRLLLKAAVWGRSLKVGSPCS